MNWRSKLREVSITQGQKVHAKVVIISFNCCGVNQANTKLIRSFSVNFKEITGDLWELKRPLFAFLNLDSGPLQVLDYADDKRRIVQNAFKLLIDKMFSILV